MGLISSVCYSKSDRRKILEPPFSILDFNTHGLKTLGQYHLYNYTLDNLDSERPKHWQMYYMI